VARRDDEPTEIAGGPAATDLSAERANQPPVVARLVVEIRSDGRMTIARGAMEDASTGRGVAIEASGRTPLQLALSLARALMTVPAFGRSAARMLRLRGARRRGEGDGDGNPDS
jgi:hypothetical protein